MASTKFKQRCLFGFGAFLAVTSGVFIVVWPMIFNAILFSQIVLSPTSTIFDIWVETPIPMYLELYLFNWTNHKEFIKDKTVIPAFEQLGPYVFLEKHYKVNLEWHDNNTITFLNNRTWHFEPNLSNGTLEDKISNLNPITATVAYATQHMHYIIRRAVDFMLREKGEGLVMTKNVRELAFEGYDDPMIDMMKDLNVTNFNIPYDKFGWFYPRNGSATSDGIFNMYTGKGDINNLGVIERWNHWTNTPYYPGQCGFVNGSTGELFPPIGDAPYVSVFIPDFCSSVTFERNGTAELFGVTGNKFTTNERFLDNGTRHPEMSCYHSGDIMPSGVLNVSLCKFGAPAFISYPHFYLADEVYRKDIDGMKPNATEHEMYLLVEPISGIPMDVRAQIQINLLVKEYEGLEMFKGVPKKLFPMLIFSQKATLTKEYAKLAKFLVILPNIGTYTFIGFCAIGVLIIFIGIMLTAKNYWRNQESQLLLNNET